MTKAMQGALLSGLVLPGLGQLALKYYWRGGLLLLATLAGLAHLLRQAIEAASAVIATIDPSRGAIDPALLLNTVHQASAEAAGPWGGLVSLALLLLWLGGTLDAYRLGRREDLRQARARPAP